MSSLMSFYVGKRISFSHIYLYWMLGLHYLIFLEVEQTGTHTQFYDKFNIRYNISQIFNSIWNNQMYRNKLREESRSVNYSSFKIINNENNIYLYLY